MYYSRIYDDKNYEKNISDNLCNESICLDCLILNFPSSEQFIKTHMVISE